MKKFTIEAGLCVMLAVAVIGMSIAAVLILPLELYVQHHRSRKICVAVRK